jgi:hypothetical protein
MRKSISVGFIIISVVVHVALVLRSYPPTFLATGDVPLKGDVSRHFATAWGSAHVEGLYGYDPYCMAGYPVGLWNSMGKKGFEIAQRFLPAVPLPALFYWVLVGGAVLAPLLAWAAIAPSCSSRRTALILLGLILLYWHMDTQISYFWDFGNVFFPATSCLLVLLTALTWRLLNKGGIWTALAAAGCAASIFYGHTVVLCAGVVPVLWMLWASRLHRWWRGKRLVSLLLAALVFLVLILPWLIPLLQNRQTCDPVPKDWFQVGLRHVVMDVLSDRVYLRHFDRNFLWRLAVLLGLVGVWHSRRTAAPRLFEVLGIGGIAAAALTYSGVLTQAVQPIQPYRFMIPASLLLLGPGALAIDAGLSIVQRCRREGKLLVAVLLVLLMPSLTAYLIPALSAALPCTRADKQFEVLDFVAGQLGTGRVLVDDSFLGHLLPYRTGKPVIGGLSAQAFLKHRYAGTDDEGYVFGRKAADWSAGELSACLATYAVELAVLTRPEWIRFAGQPGSPFSFVKEMHGYRVYRVEGYRGYVLQGLATVEADYDTIRVKDVQANELVLAFHYADWMQADQGVQLIPQDVLDDPVPFMRAVVPDGVTGFVIRKIR